MADAPPAVQTGELILLDDPRTVFEEGGNATLILCRYRDREVLFKKFRDEHLADVDEAALLKLVAWRLALPAGTRDHLDGIAAWPRHVVRDGGRLRGLLIPVAPERYFRVRSTGLRTPQSFYDLLPSLSRVAAPLAEKLATAAHAVRALLWLHGLGVVVGDLQPDNILYATAGAGVFLVDCDSMVSAQAWGRVAAPAAPDIMTVVVAGADDPDPSTDLTKLTWILLRTLLDESGLTHIGDRERARLAGLVSAETASFLLGALDRVPEPEAWLRFADHWQRLARSAGPAGTHRVRIVAVGGRRADRPRSRPPGRWTADLDYQPPPAPPLFPHRYALAGRRPHRLARIALLIGVALVVAVLAALTAHRIGIEGSLGP